jgi:hypothetical protein
LTVETTASAAMKECGGCVVVVVGGVVVVVVVDVVVVDVVVVDVGAISTRAAALLLFGQSSTPATIASAATTQAIPIRTRIVRKDRSARLGKRVAQRIGDQVRTCLSVVVIDAEIGVSGTFKLHRQLRSTRALDASPDEHVHVIRPQLVQQAAVVRDGQHTEAALVGLLFDTTADGAKRIDVEPLVDLVEHRDPRTQDPELQHLVALLLPARQVDVQWTVEKAVIETDPVALVQQRLA